MDSLKRSEIVDITLSPTKKNYSLGDQEILRHKKITGIIITPAGYKSHDGKDTQDPANAYLQFFDGNNKVIMDVPARLFQANPGAPLLHVLPISLDSVNWEKSVLNFESGITIASNTVFQMTVIYEGS
ncbi:MAG: hypothetical protein SF052_15705 [Bacteroidia bacterium]|nr:hypothetical protein [Bacteroidia bacterium]